MPIELKYQDKVDQVLNVDLAGEDQQKAIELMHKGIRLNKIDNEYAELKRQNTTWNNMLEGAKDDPEKLQQLVGMIEGYIGKPLTQSQRNDIMDDLNDGNAPPVVNKVIEELKNEIKQLKTKTSQYEQIQLGKEIEVAHEKNSEYYKGKDGYPVYDPKEVEEYLQKHPIYTPDTVENYRLAYEMLHKEKIEEANKNLWINTEKNRKTTIDKNRREHGDSLADVNKKEDNIAGKSWDDLANDILSDMKSKGHTLEVNE